MKAALCLKPVQINLPAAKRIPGYIREKEAMNIDQLKYFVSVVENRNFSLAAEECFISQSSLSKNIKSLEEELGNIQLFDRSKKKVVVTEAGRKFYKYAQNMLEEYYIMRRNMRRFSKDTREIIRVGTIPVIDDYGLTDIFHEFQSVYPHIQIQLVEDNSMPIVERFDKKMIDIAFLRDNHLPKETTSFDRYLLAEDELVLVVNRNHPLAARETVNLTEAREDTFLFLSTKSGMYQSCHRQCEKAGFEPTERVLDVRGSTIKNLVAQGQGVSLMMYRSMKNADDDRIRLIRLVNPIIIGLVLTVRKNMNSDAVNTFTEYVCDSYGKLDSVSGGE